MQAVNGADKPEEQVAALDKYAQAHADSKFMPCVDEYYTMAYLKLNNYDKVVEYGEKGLASNYKDVMLMLNVLKGYVGSGKAADSAFDVINQAPDVIKAESKPAKPPTVSDAEWQKALEENAAQAKDELAYVVYAFLQLVPRVSDPNKRLERLDSFAKTFPEEVEKNAAQINFDYFLAYYNMANKPDKVMEYGEKTIAADPNNLLVRNVLAYDYSIGRTNPDKAADYAQKAIELAQQMKKPEGVSDAQFKQEQDNQLGMAHLSLGFVTYVRAVAAKSKKQPAIDELKTAADLLVANPELQGQALYYLGHAYEYPPPVNHKAAIEALSKAASLQSSWKPQADELLAKVKKAVSGEE
jgi:tetratricopeptide (TPR) repeat protein